MFKKLALLLSVLAISKFVFANTGSEGSAAGVGESHKKAHEEQGKAHEDHGNKGHEKGHEHNQGKKGSASK